MDTDGSLLSPYLWACDELTNAKKKSKEILLLHIILNLILYTRAYYVRTLNGDNAHFIKGGGAGPSPVPLLNGTGPHYLRMHDVYVRTYVFTYYVHDMRVWLANQKYVSMRLPGWRSVLGTAAATLGAAIWYVILEELSDMLQ